MEKYTDGALAMAIAGAFLMLLPLCGSFIDEPKFQQDLFCGSLGHYTQLFGAVMSIISILILMATYLQRSFSLRTSWRFWH